MILEPHAAPKSFFYLYIEHRRVVVFLKRLVGVVLSGLVVVLEEQERHLIEGDGLSRATVIVDVGFGETFYLHHFQHHSKVEVDVEEVLFPLDADDCSGVELKVLDFDFLHFASDLGLKNAKKN